MKYFITGGTGFIGSRLMLRLLEEGHSLSLLARDRGRVKLPEGADAEIFEGDITVKESMRAGMEGADGVFHAAAWYKLGSRNKEKGYKINVEGSRNVFALAKELGIPKIIYTSTLAVFSDTDGVVADESYRFDGKHLSEYDRTKWVAHYEVAEPMMRDGLPLVIVMPGAVYGAGDTSLVGQTIEKYLQRKLPMIPRDSMLCWSHLDDAVDGHILAMKKGRPGESYIIAGPPHTIAEAFEIAEKITGIPAPKMRPSPWMMRFSAALMNPIQAIFPVPPVYRSESLKVTAGVTYLGSNEKARKELGYSPRSLEQGFRQELPKMLEELYKNRAQ
jgi:nucleoside-diphosphate-sugar epimerase